MNYRQGKIADTAKIAKETVLVGNITIGEESTVLFFTAMRCEGEETIVIGNPICSSMNSTYLRQFSGRSSYFLIPRISCFHPGSTLYTGFAFFHLAVVGKSVVTSPSMS